MAAPAKKPTPPKVGDEVNYRPNERETYRAVIVKIVDPDSPQGYVRLEYTDPHGIRRQVSVPHISAAQPVAIGPHWTVDE